jgi:ferredoxin like protein
LGGEEYLHLVKINPDKESHIFVKKEGSCRACELKPCLYVCPTDVFIWDATENKIDVLWRRCVECGACEPACPGNVVYRHPRSGFGVIYST